MQSDSHSEEDNEPIFRNGNTCDLRRENVLPATPSQAMMWRLLHSALESDDHFFDGLMTEAVHQFAHDRDFLRELLNHFHPILDE